MKDILRIISQEWAQNFRKPSIWYINCNFLQGGQGRSTVIFYLEDYLEKFMDHMNNGPYQLHKNDRTTQIKGKTLKQLKTLKESDFIDSKLHYHLKPTDLPVPRLYGQSKIKKLEFSLRPVASHCGSTLYSLYKYIGNILKAHVEDENNNTKDSTKFCN